MEFFPAARRPLMCILLKLCMIKTTQRGEGERMEGEIEMYRECLRNHAASLGSYATHGCEEFTLDESSPRGGSLHCAGCSCHQDFHCKVTYAAAAPTMVGFVAGDSLWRPGEPSSPADGDREVTVEQKEKMPQFAEKLGWKLQRKDLKDEIEGLCRSVGVSRQVFKAWMQNHKYSSSSSASTCNASSITGET